MVALVGTRAVRARTCQGRRALDAEELVGRSDLAQSNHASNTEFKNRTDFVTEMLVWGPCRSGGGPEPGRGSRGLSSQRKPEALQGQMLETVVRGSPAISDGPIFGISIPFYILYGI